MAQLPAAKIQMMARKGAVRREVANSGGKTERTVSAKHIALAREKKTGTGGMERTRTSGVALRPYVPKKRAELTSAKKDGTRRLCVASTSNSLNLQVVPECELELTSVRPLVAQPTVPEEHHSLGLFIFIPTELCHMIFLLLDHSALGYLALTSTQVCSLVQSFLFTHTGLRKVLLPSLSSFQVDPQNFAKLGKCLLLCTPSQVIP